MKITKSQSISFNDYSNMVCFTTPPYSKLLNVIIDSFIFTIIYEYDSIDEINEKYFYFRVVKDKELNFSEFNYEYYKTITEEDQPKLSSYLSGDQINLSIIIDLKYKRISMELLYLVIRNISIYLLMKLNQRRN